MILIPECCLCKDQPAYDFYVDSFGVNYDICINCDPFKSIRKTGKSKTTIEIVRRIQEM